MWVALVLGAPVANASHYRLPIDPMIPATEATLLAKAGVTTTLALLQEVATADKRKALAKKSGLTQERVTDLAHQVDLLRIDGLGPSMVRLLQASGVANSRALAGEDPAALHQKMTAANASAQISPVIPQVGLVSAWIGAAKALPQVVTGLK
jgi:predicted flap endonuclease-1-like 5' DNA nuclease